MSGAPLSHGRSGPSPAPPPGLTKEELWPDLEELGEARVRELLELQIYRGRMRFLVEEWLRYKEFPRAKAALRRQVPLPSGAAANRLNRVAIVAAGTVAAAAFLAHWTILS